MPIYISNKAIINVGIEPEELNPENPVYPVLHSRSLCGVAYLEDLNRNPLTVKSLNINTDTRDNAVQLAIKRVKTGLNALSDNSAFTLPGSGFLDHNNGSFDAGFELAIKAFQDFAGLDATGIIDVETIRALDAYLIIIDDELIFNSDIAYGALDYIGKIAQCEISLFQNVENGEYQYKVYTKKEGEEPILITSSEKLLFRLITINDSGIPTSGRIAAISNEKTKEAMADQDLDLKQFIYVDTSYTKQTDQNGNEVPLNQQNFDNETDNTPPRLLSDAQVKKYLVKNGDSLIDIIRDNYYGDAENIMNPYHDELIFQLPARQLSNNYTTRGDDARLQFYLNLLYYFNTEDNDGIIKEYGIKSALGYQRYDPEDLNAYYIFDNEFDNNDPNTPTVFPNYYRFIKAQELNGTSIAFSPSTGEPTTFVPQSGKWIWIPTRRFADSLYYYLNFRHFEFLQTDSFGNNEYVSEQTFLDFISDLQGKLSFSNLVGWLKDEILNLYEETLAFYKAAYNFLVNKLTEAWPRGVGGILGVGVGVTWGMPVATDIEGEAMMWRKMTRHNELVLMLKKEAEIKAGLDVAAGTSVGFNLGSGKKKSTTGFKLGVGASAMQNISLNIEYEFPVRPDEVALISILIAATANPQVFLTAEILSLLNIVNISPSQYISEMRMGINTAIDAWGAVQLAVMNGEVQEDNVISKTTESEPMQLQNKEKSYSILENILGYLDGIGLIVNGNITYGSELTIRYEYDGKSLLPDINCRFPKKIEIENLIYAEGSVTAGAMGNLLQRILLNLGVSVLPDFTGNAGYGIAVVHQFERPGSPKDITAEDMSLKNLNGNTEPVDGSEGKLNYINRFWKSYIKFGSITGEPERLCVPGTESMVILDTFKLFLLAKNAITFTANLQNVIDLFYGYSYRYKLAGDFRSSQVKTISNSVFNGFTNNQSGQMETGVKRDILTAARKNKFGISLGAGLDIQLMFVVADIIEILKFYLQYHYLQFNPNDPISPSDKKSIDDYKKALDKNRPEDQSLIGIYYTSVYTELNDYLEAKFGTQLQGVSYTEQLIAYTSVFKQFHNYLKGEQTMELINLGVPDIIKALVGLAQLANATVAVEGKLGLDANFHVRIITVRLALSGEAGFMDHTMLMEKGNPLELDPSDPLYRLYNSLEPNLDTELTAQNEDGLRRSIINVSTVS